VLIGVFATTHRQRYGNATATDRAPIVMHLLSCRGADEALDESINNPI
jgi:hypothetical protein